MKGNAKIYRFVLYQFLYTLAVVLLCALLSGIISYRTLYDDFENWSIETNNKLMDQYAKYIDNTLGTSANKIYMQILNEITSNQSFNFYSSELNATDILYTLDVQSYLSSIQNSSDLLKEVSVYYPKSNLLIANDRIRYTLFYELRQKEIQQYADLLQEAGRSEANSFYVYSDTDRIYMVRAIKIGDQIKAGVFIQYGITELCEILSAIVPYDEGNIILCDADGNVLLDLLRRYSGNNLNDDEVLQRTLNGNGHFTADIASANSVVSYKTDLQHNWKYIVIIPVDIMMDAGNFIGKNLLIAAAVTIILGLIIAVLLSIWQTRPIKTIVELCSQSGTDSGETTYGTIKGTITQLMSMVEENESKLERIMPILRDDFIHWLLTETPVDSAEIDDRMLFTQVSFPHRNFCIIVVKTNADEIQHEHAIAYARLALQQSLNTERALCGLCKIEEYLFGLINFDYPHDDIFGNNNEILSNSKEEYRYYYATSRIVSDLSNISGMMTDATNCLKYSFMYPEKQYFTPEFAEVLDKKSEIDYNGQIRVFSDAIENCDFQQAASMLRKIIDHHRSYGGSLKKLHSTMAEIINRFVAFSSQNNLQKELEALYEESSDIIFFADSLTEIIKDEIQSQIEKNSSLSMELVEQAMSIIDAHLLDSQLSLTMVASKLGISPNYLSRTFHEIKGYTFIDHIVSEKISHGCMLLQETDMSLREISEKLNYASPQYFISIFKKKFDITPSVFRNKYREAVKRPQT